MLTEQLSSQKKGEKKESIKLLVSVAKGFAEVSPYLSRILTIIQANISEENAAIFTVISTTYGEIVESSILSNVNEDELKITKSKYELLQGFCIYNMKQDSKAHQICGSLCLTSLIETCQFILQPAYMKYIWENIVNFVDKPNFHAKSEILNALISLIFASENLFKPFSTVTLYKILDFLTDSDWLRRKLALNVVYILFIYCQDEIIPLKGHIVEFLRVLKTDKVKEVREVCMQTLKLFNEVANEEEIENEKNNSLRSSINKNKNKSPPKNKDLTIPLETNNSEKLSANDLSQIPQSTKKLKKVNSFIKNQQPKNMNEFQVNKKSLNSSIVDKKDEKNKNYIPNQMMKNNNLPSKRSNKLEENTLNISGIKKDNNKRSPSPINKNKISSKSNTPIRNMKKISKDQVLLTDISNDDLNVFNAINSSKRDLNRKEDNTFVNSKMVIKRDPSHSIFKTQSNKDFFNNAPKVEGGVEVLVPSKENKIEYKLENKIDGNNLVNYVKMNPKQDKLLENQKSKNEDLPFKFISQENQLILSNSNFKEYFKTDMKAVSFNEKGMRDLQNNLNSGLELEDIHNNHNIQVPNYTSSNNKEINNLMNSQQSNSIRIELTELMKQMKNLSEKQIFLLDTLEKTQEYHIDEMDLMKNRIGQLENTVQYLVNFIKSSGLSIGNNFSSFNMYSTNNSVVGLNMNKYESNTLSVNKEDFNSFGGNNITQSQTLNENETINKNVGNVYNRKSNYNVYGEILQELKNKNPTEAFNLALESDEINLIKLIEKISLNQIKEVEKVKIEITVSRLITPMTKGQNLNVIIPFLKTLLVTLNYNLEKETLQNIYDALLFTFSNKNYFTINNEEVIDLNLLISIINSKLN